MRRSPTLSIPNTLLVNAEVAVEGAILIKMDMLFAGSIQPVAQVLLLLGGGGCTRVMARTTRFCSQARAHLFLRYRFFKMRAWMASSYPAIRITACATPILSFPWRTQHSWQDPYSCGSVKGKGRLEGSHKDRDDPTSEDLIARCVDSMDSRRTDSAIGQV